VLDANNPLGIQSEPGVRSQPYRVITAKATTFEDEVLPPDIDVLRKFAQVSFYFYPSKRVAMIYVTADHEDASYEVTFAYPATPGASRAIAYEFVRTLYRVCPILILKRPELDASIVRLEDDGPPEIVRTVTLRYASYKRPQLAMLESAMVLHEIESPELDLAPYRGANHGLPVPAPYADRGAAEYLSAPPLGLPGASPAVPTTDENPLGIALASGARGQRYRLHLQTGVALADVVAAEDRDLLRKLVEQSFTFYPTKRTAEIYLTHDAADAAYELSFAYPQDADKNVGISYEFLDALLRVCPMLFLRRPEFDASNSTPLGRTEPELVRTVSLRLASHKRQKMRIRDTVVLLYETETGEVDMTPFKTDLEERAAKRARHD
jgi:hypothetical protein